MGNPHKRKKLARLEEEKAKQQAVAEMLAAESAPTPVVEEVAVPVAVETAPAPVEEPVKPTKKKKAST